VNFEELTEIIKNKKKIIQEMDEEIQVDTEEVFELWFLCDLCCCKSVNFRNLSVRGKGKDGIWFIQ